MIAVQLLRMPAQEESDSAAYTTAMEMWDECQIEGQSARTVHSDATAFDIRKILRTLAHGGHMRVRTARIDDTVVIAAVDAPIWDDDAETMQRKLTPPERQ